MMLLILKLQMYAKYPTSWKKKHHTFVSILPRWAMTLCYTAPLLLPYFNDTSTVLQQYFNAFIALKYCQDNDEY